MTTEKEALDLIAMLKAKRLQAEESLARTDEDLRVVERFLQLKRELLGETKPTPAPEPTSNVKASDLMWLSQMDALDLIADRNDEVVVVKEARRLFIEARLSRSKFVSQGIHGKLARSGRYELFDVGRYRRTQRPVTHRNGRQQQLHA